METAFLFDRRACQNKFRVAEEPIHKDREAVGWTGLSMEAQGVYSPQCTVVPALFTFAATGDGSRRRAQHMCVVSSHKREQHTSARTTQFWPFLTSIYPFIFSLQGNMEVLWPSLGAPVAQSHVCGGAEKGSLLGGR